MFDIAPAELLVLGVVAIAVIPPKDLPRAMRTAGHWIGKVRGVARQFRSGFDEIIRESEIQEMEKKWRAENERIMREHSPSAYLQADGEADRVGQSPPDERQSSADEYREVAVVTPLDRPHRSETDPAAIAGGNAKSGAGDLSPVARADLPPLDRST